MKIKKKTVCPICKSSRIFYEVWIAKYRCYNCGFISPFIVEELREEESEGKKESKN